MPCLVPLPLSSPQNQPLDGHCRNPGACLTAWAASDPSLDRKKEKGPSQPCFIPSYNFSSSYAEYLCYKLSVCAAVPCYQSEEPPWQVTSYTKGLHPIQSPCHPRVLHPCHPRVCHPCHPRI
uniref:Uncharacterized protein n=1 Tax=Malurus cyaneus samueli TaxID=2593467 RepID=A0A8C5UB76_9PASS